jgi:hypothetical protein
MEKVLHWWRRDVRDPLLQMTAHQRVGAATAGVLGGLFPVPCVTTVVTLGLARAACLSAPQSAVALAINLAATPLEILLIPTLAKIGSVVTGADGSSFTADALLLQMNEGIIPLITNCASFLVHAVLAWTLLTIASVIALRVWRL